MLTLTPTEIYLLDTNVASWASYQGSPHYQQMRPQVDALGNDSVFVSPVSIAEVEYGLNAAPMDESQRQLIRNAIAAYQILELNRYTAEEYGKIRAILFHKFAPRNNRHQFSTKYIEDLREPTTGKQLGIQENDLWIVSVAVQYNVVFVTADTGGGMKNIVDAANYNSRTQFWNLQAQNN